MQKITKTRFIQVFAPGTKWKITKAWALLPGEHPESYFQRTVRTVNTRQCVTVRKMDGADSYLDLKQYATNTYWHDAETGALEIRHPNEGRDKETVPFLILRYEPDDFA